MENKDNVQSNTLEDSNNKGLLNYKDDNEQSLFKVFGFQMTAPKGLKNPRIIYISFILINLLIILVLKNLIQIN